MTARPAVHRAVLELHTPVPPEVLVASSIALRVRLLCPEGCGLRKRMIRLVAGEEKIATCDLDRIVVTAPAQIGAFTWFLVSPRQEVDGVVHEQVVLPISFVTRPYGTSLAIWDVPSPVVVGTRFRLKVGAKGSGSDLLKGATVEVLDDAGLAIGRGRLGDVPWEGTDALCWTEVEVPAPSREGVMSWSAKLPATDAGLPHAEATACFSVAAVRPSDCRLTITFIDRETESPIGNAHIRLGPFRAITDACGRAELSIPRGNYQARVWHPQYEAPPTDLDVSDDLTLGLLGSRVPEEDPSARWMM